MWLKMKLLKKTEYTAKIKNVKNEIPNISNLATKNILNREINKVKNEIPSISGLETTSALTAVENKISSVSSLMKKTDYDTKVSELERNLTDQKLDKYITTLKFNKLTVENFAARLAKANLITKRDLIQNCQVLI